VAVKIRYQNRYQPVKRVKTHFKLGGALGVEQQMHIIFLYYALHDLERQSFIPENQKQKSSYEIHTLAVVHRLWID